MDDVGHHFIKNDPAWYNNTEWLFINNTYMGYGCHQIMMDQWVWYQDTSCVCEDRVLSTWNTSNHGIATIPYYDHLDTTNGLSVKNTSSPREHSFI